LQLTGFTLNKDTKALLAQVAELLKTNPDCSILINGYPAANKRMQAAADKKLNNIKTYLVETLGISADRIETALIIEGGKQDVFDIKSK
jgi:outer membrane protein OmpA-like peptidoglycan-associated protein